MKNKISVIVPVKKINSYILDEIIPALENQTYQNFELIILPDKYGGNLKLPDWVKVIPSSPKIRPADKRDLGAKKSTGEILGFIDDDAYPDKKWLELGIKVLQDNPEAAAVCGPGVTPPGDPLMAKISGWVWSTWLGAGGAGTYRCLPKGERFVDDYPTFNFLIKKDIFNKLGGFNSDFWPGEDTKLCRDLVYKLNKKILYHPKIKVFHHRRKIFLPHLKQISRYGYQRGRFARILPKTSNRIGYWVPSLLVICLAAGWLTFFVSDILFYTYLGFIFIYLWLLTVSFWQVWLMSKSFLAALLVIPSIFLTHLIYGIKFLQGYYLHL